MVVSDLGRLIALASIPLAYLSVGLSMVHLYLVALTIGIFTPFGRRVAGVPQRPARPGRSHRGQREAGDSNSTANVAGRALAESAELQTGIQPLSRSWSTPSATSSRRSSCSRSGTGARVGGAQPAGQDIVLARRLGRTNRRVRRSTIRLIAASSATVNLGISIVNTVYLLYAYEVLASTRPRSA